MPPPRSKTRIFSFSFFSSPYASAAAVGSLMMRRTLRPGDLAGVLGRLALRVVEVRGNRDDRVGDLLAEVRLSVGLELLQDHRGDLLGREVLAADLDLDAAVLAGHDLVRDLLRLGADLAEQAAHESLDRVDGVLGIDCGLTAGQLPDQALAGARERDDRRGGAAALGVGDDDGLAALHHCHHAVGGAEIDTDCLCHVGVLRGLITQDVRLSVCGTPLSNTSRHRHAKRRGMDDSRPIEEQLRRPPPPRRRRLPPPGRPPRPGAPPARPARARAFGSASPDPAIRTGPMASINTR